MINDWGREVANFFRILQVHYIPFMGLMRFQITSRHAFQPLVQTDPRKYLFSRDDFAALAEVLSSLSGRFIMSLNDRSEVRETFKRFDIEAVKTTYSIASKGTKQVGEVIISN